MFKLSCFEHAKLLKHTFMVQALSMLDEICSFLTPASELWQNQVCGTSEGDSCSAQLYNFIFSFWNITFGAADKAAVVIWSLHREGTHEWHCALLARSLSWCLSALALTVTARPRAWVASNHPRALKTETGLRTKQMGTYWVWKLKLFCQKVGWFCACFCFGFFFLGTHYSFFAVKNLVRVTRNQVIPS